MKRTVKTVALILVIVLAAGVLVGGIGKAVSAGDGQAFVFKKTEKLSLSDYTLLDVLDDTSDISVNTTSTGYKFFTYVRAANSYKMTNDGAITYTNNYATKDKYTSADSGQQGYALNESKGDLGLQHNTAQQFYPYHNFVTDFQMKSFGPKTLQTTFIIRFNVPASLGYAKNAYDLRIFRTDNDGNVFACDTGKLLFRLSDFRYNRISVKYEDSGICTVYRDGEKIHTCTVPEELSHLIGVGRAFYLVTAAGVEENVGCSIEVRNIKVYALTSDYNAQNN